MSFLYVFVLKSYNQDSLKYYSILFLKQGLNVIEQSHAFVFLLGTCKDI
ncbi:hypothetical protein Alsa2_CDS0212 [Staphylococcus phage Alsa_2]|nr:hypothetical protein Alsa2_CDS0212 [Staphylococcus phage Alsa_2]